jgi:hypothetical protein
LGKEKGAQSRRETKYSNTTISKGSYSKKSIKTTKAYKNRQRGASSTNKQTTKKQSQKGKIKSWLGG